MNRKPIAIIVITIVIMAVILTGVGGSVLSAILSLVLVFILPGYALVKLLFPENHLELVEFVALTLGLSMAIATLGGFILDWLPWGLETRTWTIFLTSITILTMIVGLLRQQNIQAPHPTFTKVKLSFSLNEGLYFLLAGIGVAIAFMLAYRGEMIQNNTDFTQMWMIPDEEDHSTVFVGINNHESDAIQYRLLIKVNEDEAEEFPLINLDANETWKRAFSFPEDADSMTAVLYRLYAPADVCIEDNPPDICQRNEEIYREVVLKK